MGKIKFFLFLSSLFIGLVLVYVTSHYSANIVKSNSLIVVAMFHFFYGALVLFLYNFRKLSVNQFVYITGTFLWINIIVPSTVWVTSIVLSLVGQYPSELANFFFSYFIYSLGFIVLFGDFVVDSQNKGIKSVPTLFFEKIFNIEVSKSISFRVAFFSFYMIIVGILILIIRYVYFN